MSWAVRPDRTLADVLGLKTPADFQCPLVSNCLENPGVVEILGPHGGGKTQLVYYMIAMLACPREYGGLDSSVFVFDCDQRFFASMLENVIKYRVRKFASLDSGHPDALEFLVRTTQRILAKITVYQCRTQAELVTGLTVCADQCRQMAAGKALVLDSLAAFYWAGRMEGDSGAAAHAATVRLVRDLVTAHAAVVLAVKPPLWPEQRRAEAGPRDYAMPGWAPLVRVRLQVARGAGPGALFALRERTERPAAPAHFYVDDAGAHFVG
jgi:hypothetical protein